MNTEQLQDIVSDASEHVNDLEGSLARLYNALADLDTIELTPEAKAVITSALTYCEDHQVDLVAEYPQNFPPKIGLTTSHRYTTAQHEIFEMP